MFGVASSFSSSDQILEGNLSKIPLYILTDNCLKGYPSKDTGSKASALTGGISGEPQEKRYFPLDKNSTLSYIFKLCWSLLN